MSEKVDSNRHQALLNRLADDGQYNAIANDINLAAFSGAMHLAESKAGRKLLIGLAALLERKSDLLDFNDPQTREVFAKMDRELSGEKAKTTRGIAPRGKLEPKDILPNGNHIQNAGKEGRKLGE